MNGQREEEVQVLVVGAGPAGLATALELAARGLAPLILERRPACGSHPPRHTARLGGLICLGARAAQSVGIDRHKKTRSGGFHRFEALSVV